MSTGYTKLFAAILDSTVWREKDHIRLMWIAMLAMADQHGVVNASIPGLADRARVTIEQCEEALECFMSPDPYSRSKEEEGRRIFEVDGGWFVINHKKYRDLISVERQRELTRLRVAKHREKKRNGNAGVTPGNESNDKQKQKQKQDQDPSDPCQTSQSDGPDVVQEIWAYFLKRRKAAHPTTKTIRLTPKRRAHIRARLKERDRGMTEQERAREICQVVKKFFDPEYFWAKHGHADPDLVFRSCEQLEKVRDASPWEESSKGNGKDTAPYPYQDFKPPEWMKQPPHPELQRRLSLGDIGNGGVTKGTP